MKIKSIRIQNFRSFKDETVEFDDHTCLVGANGSGKSNALNALNVFFRETQTPGLESHSLTEEDFHLKNTSDPIVITVTFTDLNAEAQKDFDHYFRQGQLVVSATAHFDQRTRIAEVKQLGQRTAMGAFAHFFEAEKEGKKVAELKTIYEEIKKEHKELPPPGTKEVMIKALRTYEESHPDSCEEIPSEDQFYGVSKGANLIEKYIQWVYVPAVKDASTEQIEARNTALGKLLARTVRAKIKFDDKIRDLRSEAQVKYQELLSKSQDTLKEISESLKSRLADWAHPDATLRLEWRQDPDKAIRVEEPFAQIIAGEGGFEGELPRFGHGLQRSYLLALLHELAGSDIVGGPRLILACEEPELYQHPPQARHLYNVLLKLSNENAQIIVCTHSPYFVSGEDFESVRLVRKVNNDSHIFRATYDDVSTMIGLAKGEEPVKRFGELAKLHQVLQPALSEMFFATKLVLTEGLEDIAYITAYLYFLELWDYFRRLGFHIIPVGGKSGMIQPLAIAKVLRIPTFVVFDSDGHKPDNNDGNKEMHRQDNMTILKLCGLAEPEPFPSSHIWNNNCVMWTSEIEKVVADELGEEDWKSFRTEADKLFGNTGGLRKNTLHIAKSLYLAWNKGKKSKSLEQLCKKIIEFGSSSQKE